jgi:hypothetical protein
MPQASSTGDVHDITKVLRTTAEFPCRTGRCSPMSLQEWAIRKVQAQMPGYFANARTVILGGGNHERAAKVLREYTENLEFLDAMRRTEVPLAFATNPVLSGAAEAGNAVLAADPRHRQGPGRGAGAVDERQLAQRAARDADVIVGTYSELMSFGLEDLAGKTVITNAISDGRLAELGSRGVDLVLDATPRPFPFMLVTAMLEAMAAAMKGRGQALVTDDLVELIESTGLEPRLLRPNGDKRKSRFAFVIHPLSQQYFKNVEAVGALTSLPGMVGVVEKAMAYMPPFVYSHVTGIESPTGAEAEGWLISVGGRPRRCSRTAPSSPTRGCSRPPSSAVEAGRSGHGPGRVHQGRR